LRVARAGEIAWPALTIGAANAMGILNYNFDSVLLGFLKGNEAVAWYSAAYKPVTIALALPLTYFIGLFPVLSRLYAENREQFGALAAKSLRICAVFAVPLGVGGTLLASDIVRLLFGAGYAASALPFSILVWSAVLVTLRGSYRHSLNAAGHQKLDLRCAITSAALNVGLNILLIPKLGMLGAACATVFADIVWFVMAVTYFQSAVMRNSPFTALARPIAAGALMAALLYYLPVAHWMARGALATAAYFAALVLLGEPELRSWLRRPAYLGRS
jgi:O-antigen/teichoic acid export membrane protein